MRDDIVGYKLEVEFGRESFYKAYFPAGMSDSEKQNRAMLLKWAETFVKDIHLLNLKGFDKDSYWASQYGHFVNPPRMLLWMADYPVDHDEPQWQIVISSSADGITPKEPGEGRIGALFNLGVQKDYYVEDDAKTLKLAGTLSAYLVMDGQYGGMLATKMRYNPVMHTLLSLAIGRFTEVAGECNLGSFYCGSLRIRQPYVCRSGEITFSLETGNEAKKSDMGR